MTSLTAAAALHKADAKAYLSNFTADQGWFFGMLWASGAHPFIVNGTNITINFTSPEATRVATLWGDLMKSGNLSPIDTYTNDWNTALGNGTIACWQAGAWGTYISGNSPDYKGKWSVYLMPQWTAGGKVNGNYGGSTIAVAKASAHPKEAAAFDLWLNTDAKATLELTNPDKAGLFPTTLATLANPCVVGCDLRLLERPGDPPGYGRSFQGSRSRLRVEPLHQLRVLHLCR